MPDVVQETLVVFEQDLKVYQVSGLVPELLNDVKVDEVLLVAHVVIKEQTNLLA